jgi:UDPglucose 6-dehydrogenase
VPTPIIRNAIDLSCLMAVAKDVATCLRKKGDYHVVVVKSTVVPGTTELRVIPLLEKFSRKKAGGNFGVCINPEFLTEIHQSWTKDDSFQRSFFNNDRAVIGEFDQKSGDTLSALYESLGIPLVRTNLRTAEMIKYACNCALATKISYWNEIFYICKKAGIDSGLVAETASMDERIGKYGTIHGKAFGGKCLPKDLRAFVEYSEKLGYDPILLKAVEAINMRIKTERGVRE